MKAKYIIASLVAVCALAIGCTKEKANVLDEVQVSSSYVGVPKAGGSTTIKVTATDSWVINIPEEVDWLTITPQTGSKGETPVAFSAETTLDGRTCEVYLVCKDKIQIINVIQGLAEVANATCKEIAEGPDGKTYRVTGICTKISNTQYGNWYLNDGTVEGDGTYIYGTVNASGAYDWASFGIEIGDEVTVEGPKTTYNGTVELVDAQFISINKSLIKCDSLKIGDVKTSELPIEGGEITAYLSNKGTKLTVEIPDADKNWISMSALDGNKVTFFADANEGGDRSTTVIFKTTDGKKDYTAQATISQKGAILEVSIAEFNAKEDGDSHVYRISGIVTSIAGETDNYGTNLYIQDATGKAYIYGTVNAAGKAEKLSAKGVKAGDIVEVIGKKTSYKSNPQMANGTYQWHKSVTPLTADKVAALSDDDKNDPKNYIQLTGKVAKNSAYDIAPYGNFDLVDATGSILVYGVSTGWKGETKKFDTLGVKEGDTITIVAYKTSYKSNPQVVGMYVSHEAGVTPEPVVETSPAKLDSDAIKAAHSAAWTYTSGEKKITAADGSVWTAFNTYANVDQVTIQMNKGKGSYVLTPLVAEGKSISKLTVVFNTKNDGTGTDPVTRTLDIFDGETSVKDDVKGDDLTKGIDITGTHRQLKIAPNETNGGACYIVSATIEFK